MSLQESNQTKEVSPPEHLNNVHASEEVKVEPQLEQKFLKPTIKLKRKEKKESKEPQPLVNKVVDPIDEVTKRFFESQRVGEQVINTKKPVTISDGSLASTRCEDCHKSDFTMNRAEGTIVCTNCGLVKESRVIDETSEWRNFSNENGDGAGNTRNRVGGKLNPYMSDFGLSTMVKGSGATNV